MVPITSLWIPIFLSAVIVFIASSVLHMIIKYHKSDYRKLSNEDSATEVLRAGNIQPGFYAFPHMTDPKEMKNPEVVEKFKRGPVGLLTIFPSGAPAIGKNLLLWFSYAILIGVFVAYITGRTTPAGAEYLSVFRLAGTVAFLGYGVGHIVDSIWMGRPWGMTTKHVIDGFIYSLLTTGTFGWLWP